MTVVLGLTAALMPFATSAAQSAAESDLTELIDHLRAFETEVRNNELTEDGIRRRAKDAIALKRDFVANTAGAAESDVTPYFDLKKIDDRLDGTVRKAGRRSRAINQLERAHARTNDLSQDLAGQGDENQPASDCLADLADDQQALLDDMEAGSVKKSGIKRRANGLIEDKLDCVAVFPPKFDQNFQVVYKLLKNIDENLESIADRKDESKADVLDAIDKALGRARELRRIVREWDGGTEPSQSPTGSDTMTPTRSPTSSPSPTSSSSPRPTSTTSASPSPTSSTPSDGNAPPSVSGIGADYDSGTHETTYTIFASDQDGDPLTYAWSKSNERTCGTFTSSENTAVWDHAEPPCLPEGTHPGTITVVVSDGHYDCTATYSGGSASGTGNPPECVRK